jgi:murein DD-endopeptidase MepM/ murein hydrolase activator NlpD
MSKSVFQGNFKITGEFLQKVGYWAPPRKPHTGLDLVGITSKQIFSPIQGKVEFAGNAGDGFGNYVRLKDSKGIKYYLCHMEALIARTGQTINYGSLLGIMGHTGNVTAAHTHFEIRIPKLFGYTLGNPAAYLGLPNKQGEYTDVQVNQVIPTVVNQVVVKRVIPDYGSWSIFEKPDNKSKKLAKIYPNELYDVKLCSAWGFITTPYKVSGYVDMRAFK